MSNAEYYTADRGESWKFELMRVIDECMRCAGNREEFLILLRSEGYDATWTDSRKNITYVTPDGRKCRDSKLHIEKYLKENIEAEFGYTKGQVGYKSAALKKRQAGNTSEVIAYADRANERLRRKYYKMILSKSKRTNVAKTAVARELACFIWGMMTDRIA